MRHAEKTDTRMPNVIKIIIIASLVTIMSAMMLLSGCQATAAQEDGEPNVAKAPEITLETDSDDDEPEVIESNTIYPNVFVEDIDVGDMTLQEAEAEVYGVYENSLDGKVIELTYNGKSWNLTYEEMGAEYAIKDAVNKAYTVGRTGSEAQKEAKIADLEKNPEIIKLDHVINKDKATEKLNGIAEELNILPVDATIKRLDGKFVTTSEANGITLNVEKTYEEINKLLDTLAEGKVELVMEEALPKYTKAQLDKVDTVIGSFQTNYNASAGERNVNLIVGTGKVNDHFLFPGEVFSTNVALGPSTIANGYRPAPVIVNGKLEDGIGGGVCQVSSTLYNAALYAELEISERQNHSLPVGYVKLGFDATLAGDYIDLKIKNNKNYPIYIEGICSGGKLRINIYGHEDRPSNRKIEFYSVLNSKTEAPAEKVTEDPNLPLNERVVDVSPLIGQKLSTFKKVLVDGKLVETVPLSTSNYRARRAEVRIGTGAPREQEEVLPASTDSETGEPIPPTEEAAPTETEQTSSKPPSTLPEITLPTINLPINNEPEVPANQATEPQPPTNSIISPVNETPDEDIIIIEE